MDENRDVVTAPTGLTGTCVEVAPTGRYLYAGYKDIYEQGSHFHIDPDWRLIDQIKLWRLSRDDTRRSSHQFVFCARRSGESLIQWASFRETSWDAKLLG